MLAAIVQAMRGALKDISAHQPRPEGHLPSYKGRKPASARASAAARGSSKKTDTRCELLLRRTLWAAGARYRKNVKELPGRPDIVFPKAKLVVFCDGDFWHGHNWESRRQKLVRGTNPDYWIAKIERNIERDRLNRLRLEEMGWTVLRLWETEIRSNPLQVADKVLEALGALDRPGRHSVNRTQESRTTLSISGKMPKLISLYTGAGGLDLGFEAAGFETAIAVEMDPEAVATLRHNRDWPILDQDIHTVTSTEILKKASLGIGEADALIGGPPCQPFSKSGYWASGDTLRLDDPRAGTLGAYLRVLRDTLPQTFLIENVPGLVYRNKNEGLVLIQKALRKINRDCGTNYRAVVGRLNAADYGVPQLRERVFVVGHREGKELSFPAPTHAPDENGQIPLGLQVYTTAWDAIGDLEVEKELELKPRGKWADLLPSIPEGENYLWHTERGGGLSLFGWRRRYWSFLLKLAKSSPSWTIQAQPGPAIGPFHWKNRRLSAKELCRIQTVPDNYTILGSLFSAQRQLGNAVPSALAEIVALHMRRQLLGHEVGIASRLIPRLRRPIPAPEPPQPVPRKYQNLIGDHEAHPGTGKGYAASRRKELADLEEATSSRQLYPLSLSPLLLPRRRSLAEN